jgi:hypothetical protein
VKPQRETPRLSIEKREKGERGRSGSSLALSIVIHAFVILALAAITFHYPIGQLIGLSRHREQTPERLQYIVLPKGEPVGNGARVRDTETPKKGKPAPLQAPAAVPNALPSVPAEPTEGAVSGKQGGTGGARAGIATGVEPAEPDPRIPLAAYPYEPIPKTPAERVDSAVKAAFGVYFDSAQYAAEHPERAPGDWTKTTADGQKWGWDPTGIRLGKFTIPNVLLAAIPLRAGNGRSPVDLRTDAFIRRDILEHAQQSISEDEFRAAVRRIRERKERERREKEKSVVADSKGKDGGQP